MLTPALGSQNNPSSALLRRFRQGKARLQPDEL